MQENKINISRSKKWLKTAFILALVTMFSMFAISSVFYRTLIVNPVIAWHGTNLSIRSVLGMTDQQEPEYDAELIKRISKQLKEGQLNYKDVVLQESEISDTDIKKLALDNQQRQSEIQKSIKELQETRQQLLNVKGTIGTLDKDLSNLTAFEQDELIQREAAAQAIAQSNEPPTQEEVNALLAKRDQVQQTLGNNVPVEVLNNVQKTTGISAEEVNELLNR